MRAPRLAHDRGVEAAGKAAVGGGDDQQMHLVRAGAGQQRRRARLPPCSRASEASIALHALGIGPRRLGLLLGAAQLRGRHHLHRRGDLLRRLDAADAEPEGPSGWASRPRTLRRTSWRSRRGTPFSFSSVVLEISRLSRIAARIRALGAQSRRACWRSKLPMRADRRAVEIAAGAGEDRAPPAPRPASARTAAASAARSAASRAPAGAGSRRRGRRRTARRPPSRGTAPAPA